MTFYSKLLELCKKRSVSPSVVAKSIGLSNSSATYWKRGSAPKIDTVRKIAAYFDVSISDFIDKEDIERAQSFAKNAGNKMDATNAEDFVLNDALEFQLENKMIEAQNKSDEMILSQISDVPNEYLERLLVEKFKYLTRRGKFEILELIDTFIEGDRFRRPLKSGKDA